MKKLLQSVGSVIAMAIAGFAIWQYVQIGDLGDRIEDKGVEIYYTDNVKEGEAGALLKYLVDSGFADGTDKTLQLDRGDAQAWVVRAVVEEEDAEAMSGVFVGFARELSSGVFEGAPVIIHLCDENMKTHKAMEPVAMSVLERDQVELFYGEGVDKPRAEALLAYLIDDGFGDGTPKSLAIERPAPDRWLLPTWRSMSPTPRSSVSSPGSSRPRSSTVRPWRSTCRTTCSGPSGSSVRSRPERV